MMGEVGREHGPLDCQPGAWLGDVAQLVEHLLCKQGVGGSSPLVSTKEVFCVWTSPIFTFGSITPL